MIKKHFWGGNRLLNFCKTNSLYITNGKVHGDADSGNFTTTRASVVDYFICNADLFKFVKHFKVLKFNCLYSDIHVSLTCQLSSKMSLDKENSKDVSYHANLTERIRSWDPTMSNEFCQNINTLNLLKLNKL